MIKGHLYGQSVIFMVKWAKISFLIIKLGISVMPLFRVISSEKYIFSSEKYYFSDMFILMVKCDIKIYASNWGTYKTSFNGDFDSMI